MNTANLENGRAYPKTFTHNNQGMKVLYKTCIQSSSTLFPLDIVTNFTLKLFEKSRFYSQKFINFLLELGKGNKFKPILFPFLWHSSSSVDMIPSRLFFARLNKC